MARRMQTLLARRLSVSRRRAAQARSLGYAYAGPYRAPPAYRWSVENSIYVAPEAHRRGIGRLLLRG